MARITVSLMVVLLLCALPALAAETATPEAAAAPEATAAPAAAPAQPAAAPTQATAVPAAAEMPAAVDEKSLGFGSSAADAERIMGKPTRVAAVTGGEEWLYGRSRVTLIGGKVVGWCKWDKPLPVNIGAAKPCSPPAKVGMTAKELAASLGTPGNVAWFGDHQVWFYGMKSFTLKNGRVVPSAAILQMAPTPGQMSAGAKPGQSKSNAGAKPRSQSRPAQRAPAPKPRKR